MKGKLIKQANEYFLRSLIKDIPSSINVYHKISETEGEFGFGKHSGKLSIQNCDEIFGVVDVKKLANERSKTCEDCDVPVFKAGYYDGFQEGFEEAMELNKDKLFTKEDMRKAYNQGGNDGANYESACGDHDSYEQMDEARKESESNYDEFIQSLQQPKEIEVEIVMDKIPADLAPGGWDVFPKLDAKDCLILKKVL